MTESKNNISSHILPTAANLLGLCFVIFSIITVNRFSEYTLLDEMTSAAMVFFLCSCLFSYASIRSIHHAGRYEKVADVFFLVGLVSITFITLLFVVNVVR